MLPMPMLKLRRSRRRNRRATMEDHEVVQM